MRKKRKIVVGLFLFALFSAGAEAQWTQSLPINSPVISLAVNGTTLIAGTNGRDTVIFIDTSLARYAPTIYLTTDNGTSWAAPDTAVKWGGAARCFAVNGPTVYAGIFGGFTNNPGLIIPTVIYSSGASTNFARWEPAPAPTPDFYFWVFSMAFFGSDLYIGGSDAPSAFYRSTNSGAGWTAGGSISEVTALLALSDTNLFGGSAGEGMFRSNNTGTSWMTIDSGLVAGTYARWINCLASSDTSLFMGTPAGIFRSSNNGTSWTKVNTGLTDTNVTALAVSGSTIFAGTSTQTIDSVYEYNGWYFGVDVGGGIFRSTDNGATWAAVNAGFPAIQTQLRGALTDMDVRSLAVCGGTLFAGSYAGGVWQRPLSDMATSVEPKGAESPVQCRLDQNYPNPFNPSTNIQFSIVHRQLTIVKVYDVLGRVVATLVNEVKEPGSYTVQFSARGGSASGGEGSNLASGVYFYRLTAGQYVECRKMIVIK